MNLDDILSNIDGVGEDTFTASGQVGTLEPERVATSASFNGLFDDETTVTPLQTELAVNTEANAVLVNDGVEMVLDLELEVLVELGETRLPLREVMQMQPGSHINLPQRSGDPLAIYVNGQVIAYGEPLIVNGLLAVKITTILTETELQESLSCA